MNLTQIYENVVDGYASPVKAGVREYPVEGASPEPVLNQALIPAINEIWLCYPLTRLGDYRKGIC